MIEHKIEPRTPDEVCLNCQQLYEGECRAFSVPHSREEKEARSGPYGMECDAPHLKKVRYENWGILYHTPEGKYDA